MIKIKIDKTTPKEYLIYLAGLCKKEIKYYMSINIKCRDEGKYNNYQINEFTEVLERINKAGLKTDIYGNLT